MRPSDVQITTPRLHLRPIRIEDFDAWAALMADAEGARHIGAPQPRSVAWRGFMSVAGAWHLTGCSMFSVIEKATGRWIGRVGPWQPEGWPGPEIGWAIVRESRGRGYATEAAAATIDWAFATLEWTEIIHTISPDNVVSQRVARKLGSCNRGPGRLPPPYESHAVEIWGQSRLDWQTSRSAHRI